jgi:hypothetical protein
MLKLGRTGYVDNLNTFRLNLRTGNGIVPAPQIKRRLRSPWLWIFFVATLASVFGWLILRHETVNEMYPSLDKLSSIPLSERWSNPEMIKIRQLGRAVVPPLRRVLGEKDKPTTRFLLWVKTKWPGVTRFYQHMPDPQKMTERRWTACQVLQMLGPAAKPAVPEMIEVIESKDPGDVNAGAMALWARLWPDAHHQLAR